MQSGLRSSLQGHPFGLRTVRAHVSSGTGCGGVRNLRGTVDRGEINSLCAKVTACVATVKYAASCILRVDHAMKVGRTYESDLVAVAWCVPGRRPRSHASRQQPKSGTRADQEGARVETPAVIATDSTTIGPSAAAVPRWPVEKVRSSRGRDVDPIAAAWRRGRATTTAALPKQSQEPRAARITPIRANPTDLGRRGQPHRPPPGRKRSEEVGTTRKVAEIALRYARLRNPANDWSPHRLKGGDPPGANSNRTGPATRGRDGPEGKRQLPIEANHRHRRSAPNER